MYFYFFITEKEYTQILLHAQGTGILELKGDKINDPLQRLKAYNHLGSRDEER